MTGPLKMFGGKHYLARKIARLFPPHTHYVEPYAGGLSVLLAQNPEGRSEVVNDINGGLMNFWRVLQSNAHYCEFQRIVEAVPFSQDEWRNATAWLNAEGCKDGACVVWAVNYFIACRQSLSGRMRNFSALSKTRTRRGMNEQVASWLSAVDGLADVHARLQRVVIYNMEALDVISREDSSDTLFYLDPPYMAQTRRSPDVYDDEMTNEQHQRLLETIILARGKVAISGYHCELYDAMLKHWHCTEWEIPNHASHTDKKRVMTECVWTNFPVERKP